VLSHPATETTLREAYSALSTASTSSGIAGSAVDNASAGNGSSGTVSNASTAASGTGGDITNTTGVPGDVGYDYLQILSREETIKVRFYVPSIHDNNIVPR